MKSIFRGGFIFVAVAVLFVGAVMWYILDNGDSSESGQGAYVQSSSTVGDGKAATKSKTSRVRRAKKSRKLPQVSEVKVEKPDLTLSENEQAKLTEEMRKIYEELQLALDEENSQRVFSLVHKLQSMDEWPDGIPQSVKMRALDALAWFGSSGMAEAVGFLADQDQEVVKTTIEKFEEMLSDFDLGDKGLSDILSQIVKVVHDRDALDMFYMEMNNMRETVKAQTALNIYDSGNKDAISVLEENLDFIFCESDNEVKTREDVEKYLKDAEQTYLDDPEKAAEDEEFYGPPKN